MLTPADAMALKLAGAKLYVHAANDAESVTALLGIVNVQDGFVPQPNELLDHAENANSGFGVARIVTCEPCARIDVPVGEVVPPAPAVTLRSKVGVLVGTKLATKFTACAGMVKVHVAPCTVQAE